ncbi:MAG: hypothetical protein SFU27_01815 [Thermonemataceae bacterium]|nr:hypothetical protein [Thermonemataceae bacterium]
MNKIYYLSGYLFSLMFILYGLSAEIFERKLFFNEILSLVGFVTFFIVYFKKNFKIILPKSPIFKYVLFFLLLNIFHLITSFYFKTNLYYYLRNSVIFYSIFVFFWAFYFYEAFLLLLLKVKRILLYYIGVFLIYPSYVFLERFTTSFFFPLFLKRININNIIILVILNVILAIQYSSLTVTIIALLVSFFILIRTYSQFKIILIGISVFIITLSIYLSPSLKLYKDGEYQLYGQGTGMNKVVASNFLLSLDYNTTWRTVFWYRVISENFPKNFIGIGFGTPLIYYKEGFDTADSSFNDEHDAHVTGCHNTFITLHSRLGIGFILIMLGIYREVFRNFYKRREFLFQHIEGSFFIAFIVVTIIGCFNLLLESPTASGIFWALLGFVTKIIHKNEPFIPKGSLK